MLFQHINRHADKHRKRVYLVLVAVIGLSFVVFVTPRGCDNVGRETNRKVGVVAGKKVTLGQFRRALDAANVASYLRTGRGLQEHEGMDDRRLRIEVMNRMLALREARRLGLDPVTREQFVDYVKSQRIFQKDGKFHKESLDNFRKFAINRLNMTGSDFDRVLRENIAIGRLQARVANGIVVSPVDVRDAFLRDNESFDISYAEVKIDAREDGDPTDTDLQAYFEANRETLLLPDQKVVRILSIPLPPATGIDAKSIAEDRLKARYEALKKGKYKDKTFEQARARFSS